MESIKLDIKIIPITVKLDWFVDFLVFQRLSQLCQTSVYNALPDVVPDLPDFYSLKNLEKYLRRSDASVKLQIEPETLLEVSLLHVCFSHFLNCRKFQIAQSVSFVQNCNVLSIMGSPAGSWC